MRLLLRSFVSSLAQGSSLLKVKKVLKSSLVKWGKSSFLLVVMVVLIVQKSSFFVFFGKNVCLDVLLTFSREIVF
jgi:hypothetical protein